MKHRRRVLLFLFVLSVITYLDRVCVAVAGDRIQDDLGFGSRQWGWIMGSFALAYGLFEIPSGALGDRRGPRRVLTRIVLWWSAFTSLTGAAWNFASMFVVRFLFGAGEAGAYPTGAAAIGRWFPARERARAMGLFWMGGRVGGAITPLLVIPMMQAFGWRVSFAVFGAFGVVWAFFFWRWFRDRPEEMDEIRGSGGPPLLQASEEAAGRRSHERPIAWKRIFSHPNLWWLMLMYHAYCWVGYFFLSWMHVFFVRGRGFTPGDLVRWSWLPFVVGGLANPLGGFFSDFLVKRVGLKWGRRMIGMAGMGLSAAAILAAARIENKAVTAVLVALALAGGDFMLPVAWAVCLDVAGDFSGTVSAAMNSAGQAGSFLTSVAFGYIVAATRSYNAPLYLMAAMGSISALFWLKIDPTRPLIDTPE